MGSRWRTRFVDTVTCWATPQILRFDLNTCEVLENSIQPLLRYDKSLAATFAQDVQLLTSATHRKEYLQWQKSHLLCEIHAQVFSWLFFSSSWHRLARWWHEGHAPRYECRKKFCFFCSLEEWGAGERKRDTLWSTWLILSLEGNRPIATITEVFLLGSLSSRTLDQGRRIDCEPQLASPHTWIANNHYLHIAIAERPRSGRNTKPKNGNG